MSYIVDDLTQHGYSVNPETNVFQNSSYEDIAYNDGDESENRVLNAIKNATDLDSLSDELETHCIDWPSTYHLSKRRGNLLRPFTDYFKNKTILEIGSGMGPITRILGESDATVLALEGTSRRAHATRLRTRDLDNVYVLSEKFGEFKTQLKFDFITLIGVLEYSNLYSEAENPHLDVLQRCFELLGPDGHLIIAIENKLGLKYFAGANEDHVGIPMFGLEDLYDSKSVRTFGKFELENLLILAGFKSTNFNSPLPDYKLTTSVITEAGLNDNQFSSRDLIRDSFGSDPQLPPTLAFNPELVLKSLSENNLSSEFSNSFLVIVGKSSGSIVNDSDLAWHYSTNRLKAYCVKTVFMKNSSGKIDVIKSKMSSAVSQGIIAQDIIEESPYIEGRLFRDHLEMLIAKPLWSHGELSVLLERYMEFLYTFQIEVPSNQGNVYLTHKAIDLIPRNIVVNSKNLLESFDSEWKTLAPPDIRQVLLRAVLTLHTVSIFAPDELGVSHSYKSFFLLCCNLLHMDIDEAVMSKFLSLEGQYQREISAYGGSLEDIYISFAKPMGRARFQPYSSSIIHAERDSAVAERDSAVAERDSAVAERDSAVAERDSAVAERDLIINSTLWRTFRPYRAILGRLKGTR